MKPIDKPETGDQPKLVNITINDIVYQVRAGNHPVAQLRTIPSPNIPQDEALSMFLNGAFVKLDDKSHIDIKGGEVFASNCPSGGAS